MTAAPPVQGTRDIPARFDAEAVGTLVLACVAGFVLLLDLTVVNLALPAVARDLAVTIDGLKWVINAYALSLGSALLLGGVLADRVDRRMVLGGAVLLFSLASLGCAVAGSAHWLVTWRVVQGVAGAFVSCAALSLLAQRFTGRRRQTALAWFAASAASATALGPLVGGLFVEHAGWRGVFLVNVPIGLAVAAGVSRLRRWPAPPSRGLRQELRELDWVGAALFAGTMLSINECLIGGTEDGWTGARPLGWGLAALVGTAAFVVVERAVAHPVLPLRYFRRPRFSASVITSFAVRAATFGAAFYLAMYLQLNTGRTPVGAGVLLLPLTLGIIAGAAVAERAGARLATARGIAVSHLVLAGGLVWVSAVDLHSAVAVAAPLGVVGLATGALSTTALAAAIGELPDSRSGLASSVTTAFLSLGTAAGVALLGVWVLPGSRGVAAAPLLPLGPALLAAALIPVVAGAACAVLVRKAPARHAARAGGTAVPGARREARHRA